MKERSKQTATVRDSRFWAAWAVGAVLVVGALAGCGGNQTASETTPAPETQTAATETAPRSTPTTTTPPGGPGIYGIRLLVCSWPFLLPARLLSQRRGPSDSSAREAILPERRDRWDDIPGQQIHY